MDLRYLGMIKQAKRTSGCSSCGSSRLTASGYQRVVNREIILPSGNTLKVRLGESFSVSDLDGEFLKGLRFQYQGTAYPEFEVV